MRLRHALNDYKRNRTRDRVFPGERRSTSGAFSGRGDRLVYVGRDGAVRDYSYPLSGLTGIERSRIGVETDDGVHWFDAATEQRYVGETTVVETVHEVEDWTIRQYDLTVDRAHVTRFEWADPPAGARLRAVVGFAPDGREGQVAHLVHENSVEAYHRKEHDYVAVSTSLEAVHGQIPERFDELVSADPVEFPRSTRTRRYEDTTLSGTVDLTATFEDGGVTVVTLLADSTETGRNGALDRVETLAGAFDGPAAFEERATASQTLPSTTPQTPPPSLPERNAVVDDLRVLSLLSAESGARIAGPEFDPFYANSGGYGYTWFRDDGEISRFLLASDAALSLSLDEWHDRSAAVYRRTQHEDGTWPHRVWPEDLSLAPGWANARLEAGDGADYQADQTASVVSFLGAYLRERDPDAVGDACSDPVDDADPATVDPATVEASVVAAVDALDATLADDGLPTASQNAWENMQGRFTHTAATYLHAYATVARAPVDTELRDHARSRATAVLDGLDALWAGDHYALRLADGERDDRLDSGTLALVGAHREYDEAVGLDEDHLDRLVTHVETTLDGLSRDPGPVRGLARFEGDPWRQGSQDDPKIWSVSTAWGANAAGQLGTLLAARDDDRAGEFYARSRDLLGELLPGGSLVRSGGYLPEQFFDDGTPDSATPLGWPHALRLATIAHLDEAGELESETATVQTD